MTNQMNQFRMWSVGSLGQASYAKYPRNWVIIIIIMSLLQVGTREQQN